MGEAFEDVGVGDAVELESDGAAGGVGVGGVGFDLCGHDDLARGGRGRGLGGRGGCRGLGVGERREAEGEGEAEAGGDGAQGSDGVHAGKGKDGEREGWAHGVRARESGISEGASLRLSARERPRSMAQKSEPIRWMTRLWEWREGLPGVGSGR